jgi:hypothetical protein
MKNKKGYGKIHSSHFGLLSFWTSHTVWYSNEHNVLETGLFSSSGENVGGTYSVGFMRKS